MKSSLVLLLAFSSALYAADGYTIKQLRLNRNRVVVEGAGLQAGQELIATFRNGSQCTLRTTAVQGRIANADTSNCPGAQYLVAGQLVERDYSIQERMPARKPAGVTEPSTAAKWEPRPAPRRLISDLQYLPPAGQWAAGAEYAYSKDTSSLSTTASKDTWKDIDKEDHALRLGGKYSLNEKFTFGVVVGYLLGRTTNTKYGPVDTTKDGTSEKTKADGLTDPTVDVTWRLTEMDVTPVIFDVKASYSPNTGKNKTGTVDNKGTGFRGGDMFSLGFEGGYKQPSYAIVAGLDFDFVGSANAVDATDGKGTRSSGANIFTLRIGGQYDLSDGWWLRGQLARMSMGETTANTPTNAEFRFDSISQTRLSVGAFKEITPEKWGVELMINRDLSADQSFKVGTTSLNQTIDGFGANLSVVAQF